MFFTLSDILIKDVKFPEFFILPLRQSRNLVQFTTKYTMQTSCV